MTDEMLMIRPERCLTKLRAKALVNKNAPFKLVSSTVSQSCSLMRISSPSRVTPALFTRMSTFPASAKNFLARRAHGGGIRHVHRAGPGLAAERADFAGDLLRVLRACATRRPRPRPSAANFRAMARPMPRPAPVTTAI